MLITIYDSAGNPKVELSPNDSSTQVKEVQGDSVLTLSFAHYDHIALDVDDYVDFEGERYWLTEKYRPRQNSRKEWVYDIKLYGVESMLKRLLVIKTVDNEDDPVFTLTAPPREHVAMIVKCMNEGMGNITDWKVGQVNGTENIVIDYFGKYCDEALKEIAEKVGAEWWVEGQTVNICKCEHGEAIPMGYDKGLLSIDPGTADNVKFYTRLYPVGSSRNIDREQYGYSRLQLPGGRKYVEINADKYGRVDHYEADAFADIYPRRIGTVSNVRSEVKTGEDGNPFTIYYFTDNSLPFDPNDYMIGGLVIRVSFQEGGELAGLGEEDNGTYYFEVNFNSKTREFEIITIWPYGDDVQLPGDKLIPKIGDKYILWNLRMPEEYYELAEAEFLDAVERYNAEHSLDIAVYKAPTDHVWIEDNKVVLSVGQRIRLESDVYFPETGCRESRITKITRRVNLPSSMDIEISDALSRTSQQRLSDSIADVRSYAKSIGESVNLPDLIRTGDGTVPTDNNIFSAKRTKTDFLSKLKDDRSAGKVASDRGFEAGKFVAGASGGMFGIDAESGRSFAEVDELWVRVKAYFESLTVIESESMAGKLYITPGGSVKCVAVRDSAGTVLHRAVVPVNAKGEETSVSGASAFRCFFLSEQGGEKCETKIKAGDQAISKTFNVPSSQTATQVSNHYWWRLVTKVEQRAWTDPETGNVYGYIEVSKSDCAGMSNTDAGSDYRATSDVPAEGDVICQFGSRDTSERQRQTAIVIDTTGSDAPSIKLFCGVDSYSLSGRDLVSFGYDAVKGRAYLRSYGDAFIGDRGGATYIDFDQSLKQLLVKGKVVVTSPLVKEDGTDTGKTLGDAIDEAGAAKEKADAAQKWIDENAPELSAVKTSVEGLDYLREAIKDGATVHNGGLALGSLIKVGEWDLSNPAAPRMTAVRAGMNGLIPADIKDVERMVRVIGSWWGGDMVDKYYDAAGKIRTTPLTKDYATALVRLDGTGYWCGGNIRFEKDYALFGSEDKGVKIGTDGTFTVGTGVTFNVGNVGGLQATLTDLANFNSALGNLFSVIDKNGVERELSYAFTNSTNVASIKAKFGLWSTDFISARGADDAAGGGGGSLYGLYRDWKLTPGADDALGATLGKELHDKLLDLETTVGGLHNYTHPTGGANKTIAAASRSVLSAITVNSLGHVTSVSSKILTEDDIPSLNWSKIATGKPTTLAGYGITDAYTKTAADSLLSDKVSKTGDTMTGVLVFGNSGYGTERPATGVAVPTGIKGTMAGNDQWAIFGYGTASDGGYLEIATGDNGNEPIYIGQYSGGNPLSANGTRTHGITLMNASGNQVLNETSVERLTIRSTAGVKHLEFSRASANYLTAPASGYLAIVPGGKSLSLANADLAVAAGEVKPGTTGSTNLGTSGLRWKGLYVGSGDFSGSVKIGGCTISWDSASNALKFSTGIYSDSFVSARGADSSASGGGGSAFGLMRSWPTSAPSATTTDALGANLGWALRSDIGTLQTSLTSLTTRVGTTETAISALQTSAANHVTLNTTQEITGVKTFASGTWKLKATESNEIKDVAFANSTIEQGKPTGETSTAIRRGIDFRWYDTHWVIGNIRNDSTGTNGFGIGLINSSNKIDLGLRVTKDKVYAQAFAKYDGKSAQFLKADGSVDSNTYAKASQLTDGSVTKVGTATVGSATKPVYLNAGTPTACSYAFGNASGNIPISNGMVNTNLNADMVDGVHNGSLTAKYLNYVSSGTWDCNNPTATLHSDYGSSGRNITNTPSGWSYGQLLTIGRLGSLDNNLSAQFMWDVRHNTTDPGILWFRARKTLSSTANGWGNWGRLAFTTDNVASATKLADDTAFKAWGQTFFENGKPQSISGNLTSVGNITGSAAIVMTANGRLTLNATATAVDLKFNNDNTKSVILNGSAFKPFDDATHKLTLGSSSAVWERIYGRYIDTDSGYYLRICAAGRESITVAHTSGYVGVNRTAPAYPLDVNGKVRIGNIVLEDDGSGNLKVNGGLWSTSFVSARGADSSASAGGGSLFGLATDWKDATTTNKSDALGANLGRWLYDNLMPKSTIESTYLTQAAAASAYQPKGNYLTAHQDISGKVSKSGDTMSGNLTLPRLNIVGTKQSTAYLTADDTANVYFNVGGRTSLVINNTEACIRPGNSYNNIFALGKSAARWSNVYSVLGNFSGQITSSVATGTAPLAVASTTLNTNLNADLLDGQQGSWYQQNCLRFRRVKAASSADGIKPDADTDLTGGGMLYNYTSNIYWVNAPAGMTYGQILMLTSAASNNLAGQLAWDINHNSTTPTRYLWWRAASSTHGFQADWHQIAFIDSTVAASTYLTAKSTPTGGSALTWYSGQPTIGTAAGNAYKGSSSNINLWSFPDGGTSATTIANIMTLRLGWNATYWADIFTSPNYDRIWYRRVSAGTAGAWRKLAFLDDKIPNAEHADLADNATKLQTARTLWGQSFNGSANVSGNMSDVGNLMPATGWTSNFGSKSYPFKSFYIGERFFIYRNNHGTQTTVDSAGKTVVSQVGMMMDSYDVDYVVPGGATAFHSSDYGKTKKATGLAYKVVHNDSQVYPVLAVHPLGRVGVCNLWPSYELDVTGTIRATQYVRIGAAALNVVSSALHCNVGFYSDSFISARGADTSSDIRLKRDLQDLRLSVDDIAKAPAVSFRWRDTGEEGFGSVAQYWRPLVPQAVHERDDRLTLEYGPLALTGLTIVARKVMSHEERIRQLEQENAELRKEIAALKRA